MMLYTVVWELEYELALLFLMDIKSMLKLFLIFLKNLLIFYLVPVGTSTKDFPQPHPNPFSLELSLKG